MSLPDLTPRDWWVGLSPGELADFAEQWSEEAERLRLALGGRPVPEPPAPVAQVDAVTLRAIAAVLDVLDEHDRGGLDIVARVALLVGEVRARREAWLQAMQLYWELRRATDGGEAAGSSAPG